MCKPLFPLRTQLVFIAETILVAALDRIESGMPTANTTWDERGELAGSEDAAKRLVPYEHGALETAGLALAVLYAQLTDDGLGIGDALVCAGEFDRAIERWVATAWADHGESVRAKMKELGVSRWQVKHAYDNYPDCHKHAEQFVDAVFTEYLAEFQARLPYAGFVLLDGSLLEIPDVDLSGTIRLRDRFGKVEDERRIGDSGWQEWRDLFPSDKLYFQPKGAGDPCCGTSAADLHSSDAYLDLAKAQQSHPDCEIKAYSGDDIEGPTFFDNNTSRPDESE